MGFMDYSIVGSDAASGFAYTVGNEIAAMFEKELKEKGDKFNTPGFVNVSLLFEAMIATSPEVFIGHEKMLKAAKKTLAKMDRFCSQLTARKTLIENGDDKKSVWNNSHDIGLARLRRIHLVLKRYIEDCGDE